MPSALHACLLHNCPEVLGPCSWPPGAGPLKLQLSVTSRCRYSSPDRDMLISQPGRWVWPGGDLELQLHILIMLQLHVSSQAHAHVSSRQVGLAGTPTCTAFAKPNSPYSGGRPQVQPVPPRRVELSVPVLRLRICCPWRAERRRLAVMGRAGPVVCSCRDGLPVQIVPAGCGAWAGKHPWFMSCSTSCRALH